MIPGRDLAKWRLTSDPKMTVERERQQRRDAMPTLHFREHLRLLLAIFEPNL